MKGFSWLIQIGWLLFFELNGLFPNSFGLPPTASLLELLHSDSNRLNHQLILKPQISLEPRLQVLYTSDLQSLTPFVVSDVLQLQMQELQFPSFTRIVFLDSNPSIALLCEQVNDSRQILRILLPQL